MKRKTKEFKKAALSTAILLATAGPMYQLHAEEKQESQIEVIEVTGLLGSLTKSAAMKRHGTGVVDAISAEDIGDFPDSNLAESLQRITGVSIDRANNEGNQVTVRGFGPSFNLVTLDGRQMPNSSALLSEGISRSFNFNEIGSESVSAVEVFKTGRADINSGGIGATINIKTAKPFDYDGFKALASIKGVVDTSVDTGRSVTPEISGMISNTFLDDRFGVLLSVSHAERDSHTDRVGTSANWTPLGDGRKANVDVSAIDTGKNPNLNVWGVQTVDLDDINTERDRQNAQLALQWAPIDSVVATVDYTLSRLNSKSQVNRTSYWFDTIDAGKADENGTLINPSRQNDELNFWAWEYAYKTNNDSLGLNIEWVATDSLIFTLDAHNSTSHANPGALPAESIANLKTVPNSVDISADFTGDIPKVGYDDSKLPGGAFNQDNIAADLYQERGYEMENEIQQVMLKGTFESDGSTLLEAIHFGVSNTLYQVDSKKIQEDNFGLAGLDVSDLDISFSTGDIGFDQRSNYNASQFIQLVNQQGFSNPANISTNGIEEDTTAVYISVDLAGELSDMLFKANLGIRYEDTDVTSYSLENPVIGFNWITALEMSKILSTESQLSTLKGDYTNTLPSLNLSLDIRDDITARVSYSTTISRSSIDAMFPATSLNTHLSGGPFTASQGNPALLPYKANNLDLSLEWYYAEGSYASMGYFTKDVDNYIAAGEQNRVINGQDGVLTDPSINPRGVCPSGSQAEINPDCTSQVGDPEIIWRVTTPVNQGETSVDGVELNIQHMFGETGFGGIANYTLVNSDDDYNPYSLQNGLSVTGLSDSANLVAFYENEQFSFRIAYNWRDEFLLKGGQSPIFTEAYSQIDISGSYDVNESVSLFIDGINITNEDTRRHGRFSNQLVDFEQYGARYNVGVRATF